MAIVHSMSDDVTTVVADCGDGLIPIWVDSPRGIVNRMLAEGSAVTGDSSYGEMSVFREVVKYVQAGKREVNSSASNRPTVDRQSVS